MKKFYTSLFVILGIVSQSVNAQIIISEYSASNLNQFPDNYGKYEDWIEISNIADTDIDISNWGISDKESKPLKWQFPEGTVLAAQSQLVVWCSGRDIMIDGQYHTNFKLTQTSGSDLVQLARPDETIIQSYPMQLTLLGHSRVQSSIGVWSIDTSPTPNDANSTDVYQSYTSQPIIDLEAGFYDNAQLVSISAAADEQIRYTLDGTLPTDNSTIYTDPLMIDHTTVVKAAAFSNDNNILRGKVAFATYFINESFTVPVFSVAADGIQDLANGQGELRPIGSLEYFENGNLVTNSYGELNRHGQDSWVNPHRSIDWVSRDEMGYSKAVDAKLFSYSDRVEYQRFMFRASGDDNYPAIDDFVHEYSCHIRDEYVHVLAQDGGLKVDLRAVERAIVFLNGEYWGLYSIRERPVDHDFTDEYYNQGKFDVQYILTWGDSWAEYGGDKAFQDWFELRDFILKNDMSIEANYELVKDQMQVQGLIDYMIANLNVVSVDWLNYNTGWWRGLNPDGKHKKWGYMLWDNDATFDYYINYTGVPNNGPDAEPCDIDAISISMDNFFGEDSGGGGNGTVPDSCNTILNGSCPYSATDSIFALVIASDDYCCETDWDVICQGIYDEFASGTGGESGGNGGNYSGNIGKHEKIFLKLQEESPEFRQLYYSRQADLMNTAFSCENMIYTLDSMLNIMTPEMPRQIERWGGTMEEWESNVLRMRTFIENRCELLDDGMINCFDVTGPYPITFEVYPAGAGEIELNTIDLTSFPWTGNYFGNMDNLVKAKAYDDKVNFLRWETTSGNAVILDSSDKSTSFVLSGMDTLVAVFDLESNVPFLPSDVQSFAVYPSPTNDVFNIEYTLVDNQDSKIEIMNPQGQIIQSIHMEGENVKQTISLSSLQLSTGMYLVRLSTDNGLATRRIVYMR